MIDQNRSRDPPATSCSSRARPAAYSRSAPAGAGSRCSGRARARARRPDASVHRLVLMRSTPASENPAAAISAAKRRRVREPGAVDPGERREVRVQEEAVEVLARGRSRSRAARPSASTRAISPSARRAIGQGVHDQVHVGRVEPSVLERQLLGRAPASSRSPGVRSSARPASISADGSTPHTRAPSRSAANTANRPVPQPTSSSRRPAAQLGELRSASSRQPRPPGAVGRSPPRAGRSPRHPAGAGAVAPECRARSPPRIRCGRAALGQRQLDRVEVARDDRVWSNSVRRLAPDLAPE